MSSKSVQKFIEAHLATNLYYQNLYKRQPKQFRKYKLLLENNNHKLDQDTNPDIKNNQCKKIK